MKPRWSNLLQHACPLCGKHLNVGKTVVMCVPPCEFRCSLKKAGEIVAGIRDRKEERSYGRGGREEDNLSALNNFGHSPQVKGYGTDEEV